jgi:hypothetical protein
MKYIVYISSQIDALSNEVKIGEADNLEDACQILDAYLKKSFAHITQPYWRYSLYNDAIFIDFGCWSKFGAVVPAVSIEEMNKDRAR